MLSVREKSQLQDWVVRRLNPRHQMSRRESNLLNLVEDVERVGVENDSVKLFNWKFLCGQISVKSLMEYWIYSACFGVMIWTRQLQRAGFSEASRRKIPSVDNWTDIDRSTDRRREVLGAFLGAHVDMNLHELLFVIDELESVSRARLRAGPTYGDSSAVKHSSYLDSGFRE